MLHRFAENCMNIFFSFFVVPECWCGTRYIKITQFGRKFTRVRLLLLFSRLVSMAVCGAAIIEKFDEISLGAHSL